MSYVDELRAGSARHKVASDTGEWFSLVPVSMSESDLRAFQDLTREVIKNEGNGYWFALKPHPSGDLSLPGQASVYDILLIEVAK